MFGINITLRKFLTQNAVNIKTVCLLMMIKIWVCQVIFLRILKINFRTTNGNILCVYHFIMKTIPKHLRSFWLITNQDFLLIWSICVTKTQCKSSIEIFGNILNSTNAFILSLVIYFLGSQFEIVRMSWYKSMKTFWDNIELVIKKCFWSLHY